MVKSCKKQIRLLNIVYYHKIEGEIRCNGSRLSPCNLCGVCGLNKKSLKKIFKIGIFFSKLGKKSPYFHLEPLRTHKKSLAFNED